MFRKPEFIYLWLWPLLVVVSLSACNDAVERASGDNTVIVPPMMAALYAKAPNWNDYVKTEDTATACDGSESGGYHQCIHGGERRAVPVPVYSSCANLSATDALGAFNWTCDPSGNPVRMVSTGLNQGKNLSDLLDFNAPAWLNNSVTVSAGATGLFTTIPTGLVAQRYFIRKLR